VICSLSPERQKKLLREADEGITMYRIYEPCFQNRSGQKSKGRLHPLYYHPSKPKTGLLRTPDGKELVP